MQYTFVVCVSNLTMLLLQLLHTIVNMFAVQNSRSSRMHDLIDFHPHNVVIFAECIGSGLTGPSFTKNSHGHQTHLTLVMN